MAVKTKAESATGEQGVTEKVQEQASELKEQGREQLRHQLDDRTTQAGQQARSLAEALRKSGSELESGGGAAGAARVASSAADKLERVGGYLERSQGETMLRDAEQFTRQRPWLVAGAAAVAGFLASRVLKASSERRYESAATSSAGKQ